MEKVLAFSLKFLTIIFALLIISTAVFFTGRTLLGSKEEPHKHTVKKIVSKESTCTENGYDSYYTCTGCELIFADLKATQTLDEIPYTEKKQHNFTAQKIEDKYLLEGSTCGEAVKYYYSCVDCGEKGNNLFDSDTILNHVGGTSSCTKLGTCTRCGQTYGELTPHVYTAKRVEKSYLASSATCHKKALYYYSCEACGKAGEETFEDGEVLSHIGGEATCVEKAICSRCGTGYGEYAPHDFSAKVLEDKYLKIPETQTQKAVYYYSCLICGEVGEETFEVEQQQHYHNFNQMIVENRYLVSDATCVSPAKYKYVCECGETSSKTYTYGETLPHVGGEATCIEKAVCDNCGNYYGEFGAHLFGEWEEFIGSTCTVAGLLKRTCERDNTHVETRSDVLLAHVYNRKVESEAYRADLKYILGNAYYYSCSCGAYGEEYFVIAPTDDQEDPIIYNAQDLHITVEDDNVRYYANKVYAETTMTTLSVEYDDSKVNYGVVGKYDLTYSCRSTTKTIKVCIYDTPSIKIESSKTTFSHNEYLSNILDGVTAKDSLGNSLYVQVFDSNGAENADGSINEGTFVIKYSAVDRAGQIVYATRTITIKGSENVALNASYAYDVANDDFILTLEEKDYETFVLASIDEKIIPKNYFTKTNGKIIIDGEYIMTLLRPGKTGVMRVITAYGQASASFSVTDVGTVAYNDEELEAFVENIYQTKKDIILPEIEFTNFQQTVNPVYQIYRKGSLVSEGRIVNFPEDGLFDLKVTLREGQVLAYTLKAYDRLDFESGRIYSDADGLVATIPAGYSVVSYQVNNYAGVTELTYRARTDSFSEFNSAFKQLNKKLTYEIVVTVKHEEIGTFTQKFNFSLRGSSTTVIATEKSHIDSGNLYPYHSEKANLEYVNEEIGGRHGAIKWTSIGKYYYIDTLLKFSSSFESQLKKGNYLSFDIYTSTNMTPCWFGKTTLYFYMDVSTFNASLINFYTNGERLATGSIWYGSLVRKWVTVEICLDEDYLFSSEYRGLTLLTDTFENNSVYLSNIKISTSSIYQ